MRSLRSGLAGFKGGIKTSFSGFFEANYSVTSVFVPPPGLTFGVYAIIDPQGQGVVGQILAKGQGVTGNIVGNHGVLAIIDSDGQGVSGSIDDTGQGVDGKL